MLTFRRAPEVKGGAAVDMTPQAYELYLILDRAVPNPEKFQSIFVIFPCPSFIRKEKAWMTYAHYLPPVASCYLRGVDLTLSLPPRTSSTAAPHQSVARSQSVGPPTRRPEPRSGVPS